MSAGSDPLTSQSAEVGLGYLNCDECEEQEERGCHRFGNRYTPLRPWAIDFTGDESHDKISFCPKSLEDDDWVPPGRVSCEAILNGFVKAKKVKACGGLRDYNGESPADSPPRVGWFYATVEGVVARYQAEVKDTQTILHNAVVEALSRRKPQEPD